MNRHPNLSRPLRRVACIAVLAAVPGTLAACGDDDGDQPPADTAELMSTEAMSTEAMSTEALSTEAMTTDMADSAMASGETSEEMDPMSTATMATDMMTATTAG